MESCTLLVLLVLVFAVAISAAYIGGNQKEGLQYLNQYEHQDFYKDHPYVYPVADTYTTGKYGFMRTGIDIDRAQRGCFKQHKK